MPWQPQHPNDFPTLGWECIEFAAAYLAAPSKGTFEPLIFTREQEDFILRLYELDPRSGRRVNRVGVLVRSRGWGKSPVLAAIGAFEALGNAVFDGWDASGQPVGKPWSTLKTPKVQFLGVSEESVANSWDPLLEMLRDGSAVDEFPGLEPMETFVGLPSGGRMEIRTASSSAVKGSPAVVACIADQTELWTKSNGGARLYSTVLANATKTGGLVLQSPNAWTPGTDSVAERTHRAWELQQEGKTPDKTIYVNMRSAPPSTDAADPDSLLSGLRYAYGDSSAHPEGCTIHNPPCSPGWVDLQPVMGHMYDPSTDVQQNKSDFLNMVTSAVDSFVSRPQWQSIENKDVKIREGDVIVCGFDGARARNPDSRVLPDATSLVGIRVSDGHLFHIRTWEPAAEQYDYEAPAEEIVQTIRETFETYKVVAFFADPARWEIQLAQLEAEFHSHVSIKASADRPFSAYPRGKNIEFTRTTGRFYEAIANAEITQDGSATLMRHALNARRRQQKDGFQVAKEFKDSPNKIDAIVASINAYSAYLQALGKGLDRAPEPKKKKAFAFGSHVYA